MAVRGWYWLADGGGADRHHAHVGATLCCDPISWFQRAKLISNPSASVLGKPGLGKSTIVRRMALGLIGYGV